MGEDGYGVTKASGTDINGEPISISTKDSELQAKTDVPTKDNIEEEIKDIQAKTNELKNKDNTQGQANA